jgi:peptidoglycan/xylan/chitin deacetylase (PgdA/CDA1 family)
MTWSHIKKIQQAGIEIGNHSDSHAYFVNLPEKERKKIFEEDFITASEAFESNLGRAPQIYAYPYGEWDREMEEVLSQKKVDAAAVQKSGVFSEVSNPMAIPRFPMGGSFATMNGFKNKLQMKALRVTEEKTDTPFLSENPPPLTIKLVPSNINTKQAQFFVDGVKSDNIQITVENEIPIIKVIAPNKLTGRRTLYTITAPSVDGKSWHWFSHLWIRPELEEN